MIGLSWLAGVRAFLAVEATGFLTVALIHAGLLPIGTPHAAALPEGIIATALIVALALTWRWSERTALIALVAQGFSLALTVVGTYVTIIGIGPTNPWDLPFHIVILIVLVAGLAVAAQGSGHASWRASLTAVTLWLIRVTGLLQLALGLGIWTGIFRVAIPFHIFNGLLFVVLLEIHSAAAAWTGAPWRLATFTAGWGLLVAGLGLTQTQLLPGDWHWVIQLAHLAVGLAAIGLAQRVSGAVTRKPGVGTRAGGQLYEKA
jgi:hypothetical protein